MPFKAFFGRKPDIGHMQVWYSDVFTHQLKDLGAGKLGECGHLVKFLGYPEESSGYKVYKLNTHKVYVVRKPMFREEACPSQTTTFESTGNGSDPNEQDNGDIPLAPTSTTATTPIPATPLLSQLPEPPATPAPLCPT